jgi:hypothetical protein
MHTSLAIVVSSIFAILAFWHFYMAVRIRSGVSGAVPSVDGKPLFTPSRQGTVAVGIVLIVFAILVAGTAGIISSIGIPQRLLIWASYILAAGLMMRAIGEFKYVGLFKKVRGSKFATLDTLIYSPLCLLLSIGVAVVAGNPRV